MSAKQSIEKIGIPALVMITIISVDSIRNLPAGALFGSSLVFYYLFGALLFFIPAGLVSADLAARFGKKSGIYQWVKEAMGIQAGLLAIWLQWIENVIWYPAILSFAASSLVYMWSPDLSNNALVLSLSILIIFWFLTWINCRGFVASAKFSTFCTVLGLILPMTIIIGLGFAWFFSGQHLAIHVNFKHFIPDVTNNTWVSLTAVMLSLCGIEVATVHAGDVKNPRTAFPRALFISTVIIVMTLILGSLSIAMVIPKHEISLVSGIMQTVDKFLSYYHLRYFLELFAFLIVIGVLGSVSNWIIAPTRGLYNAACDGYFPSFMKNHNALGAPTTLLLLQAVIVTLLTVCFMIFPHVSDFYWILTVVAAELYMLMYIMMFMAFLVIYFRRSRDSDQFRVPGGKYGAILASTLGITGCLLTIGIGLIEPGSMHFVSQLNFALIIAVSVILFTIPPVVYYKLKFK